MPRRVPASRVRQIDRPRGTRPLPEHLHESPVREGLACDVRGHARDTLPIDGQLKEHREGVDLEGRLDLEVHRRPARPVQRPSTRLPRGMEHERAMREEVLRHRRRKSLSEVALAREEETVDAPSAERIPSPRSRAGLRKFPASVRANRRGVRRKRRALRRSSSCESFGSPWTSACRAFARRVSGSVPRPKTERWRSRRGRRRAPMHLCPETGAFQPWNVVFRPIGVGDRRAINYR